MEWFIKNKTKIYAITTYISTFLKEISQHPNNIVGTTIKGMTVSNDYLHTLR